MAECNHNCSGCSKDCGTRKAASPLAGTSIKNIIGILSGKGGVGKSMVSSLLAVELAKKGYSVGIMDADITGPSIPKIFNLRGQLMGDGVGIFPAETALGIKVVSINNMLEDEEMPVIWKGPILGNVIKQFYTEVHWGELDYLLIDMPPGTSDVAIAVLQEIPVDSFVMVTTPSKLVSMVVGKAINMAKNVGKPVVGLVENMAYVKCDNCGHAISIYSHDETEETGKKFGLEVLAKLPIDPILANLTDNGLIEDYNEGYLNGVVEALEKE